MSSGGRRHGSGQNLLRAIRIAPILEYGAFIPAHEIDRDTARALHFIGSGGESFAARVHSPGGRIAPRRVLYDAFAQTLRQQYASGQIAAADQDIRMNDFEACSWPGLRPCWADFRPTAFMEDFGSAVDVRWKHRRIAGRSVSDGFRPMANVSRKAIAAALLARIAPPGGPFAVSGRRLTKPENAASPDKPALFLIKLAERIAAGAEGLPPRRMLRFHAVIYTDVGADANAVPADIIDDLIDFVSVALASAASGTPLNGARQTLGGTAGVYDCCIDGTPLIAPGDSQGKGQTLVPITVTLDQYP